MLANQAKLQLVAGFGFTLLLLVWTWTSFRKGRYACEDANAETALVRNYRRHLQEMQSAIEQIRKQKGSGNTQEINQMQNQLQDLQKQLAAVQQMKAEEAAQHMAMQQAAV